MNLQAFSSSTAPPTNLLFLNAAQTSNPNNGPKLNSGAKRKQLLLRKDERAINKTILWTSSIAHRCRNGSLSEAAKEFTRMRIAGIEPNEITFITLLSACADYPSEALDFGASIHGYTCKLGIMTHDVRLGTAVVDLYCKCGRLDLARQVFDEMCVRNSVSWNTMIDGYMRNGDLEAAIQLFDEMPERDAVSWTSLIGGFVKKGHSEEALEWFREMQLSGVEPDYVTIIAILTACANLGSLGLGIWVHRYATKRNLSSNVRVSNTLVDMYSRCGCIEFARQEFNRMITRTRVSWNSIIVGFAINGLADEALEHFSLMQQEGFKPDGVTYTGALTACSHAGLVDKGLKFYNTMTKTRKISPRIEHYGCVVDLLSRAGRLEDAMSIIQSMPMKPNEIVLGSLLAACRTVSDVGLAERVMDYLVELDPDIDSNYVQLSNIYAGFGKWHGVGKVRKKMKALGIKKKPGISAIEIDCSVHEFVAGDKTHSHSSQIYSTIDLLSDELRLYGYVPEVVAGEVLEAD